MSKTDCASDPEEPVGIADLVIPMPGKIAVLVDAKEEVTKGGIYLPPTTRSVLEERATKGVVVATGYEDFGDEESAASPGTVQVGDYVVFGKYTGTKLMVPDPDPMKKGARIELIIMNEKDVLCKIADPDTVKKVKVKG